MKGSISSGERTGPSTGDLGSNPAVPLPLPDLSCVLGLCIMFKVLCRGSVAERQQQKVTPSPKGLFCGDTVCERVHNTRLYMYVYTEAGSQ